MKKLKENTDKLMNTIYEYQRYIKLNSQFVQALEAEGADTANLRAEICELENKIIQLRVLGGLRS